MKDECFASKHVVLVDHNDLKLGILDKDLAHHENTPLHRGFSAFLFNSKGQVLIQQRSALKKTWPKFWSNSFCGHPQVNETYEQAVLRHAKFELGIDLGSIKFISDYQYKFTYNNIAEHEICPIYQVSSDAPIIPNLDEIENYLWLSWDVFLDYIKQHSEIVTPWCKEETKILNKILY